MRCFDMLADESFEPRKDDWVLQGGRMRRQARKPKDLTGLRSEFLKQHALQKEHRGQGEAQLHRCYSPVMLPLGLDTSGRDMEDALAGYPRFSARLLLKFKLLTPLLTKDDDPFHLFDNPVRKDRILNVPCLAAASLKGLSADAYQRAFPGATPWADLGRDDPNRTRAFRAADPHALRLLGVADDGGEIVKKSRAGRLRFSTVWFNQIQLLVMNPGDSKKAIGTCPIQFEAIAPGQSTTLEVIYFNPYGTTDSDEATVRADLGRWLASVAAWWPVLGLGAKRLAGYGAIAVEQIELQAVGWSGMAAELAGDEAAADNIPEPPGYYAEYLGDDGAPIAGEQLEARIQQTLAPEDAKIGELDQKWRHARGETQSKAKKRFEKAQRRRDGLETELRGRYGKVVDYWRAYGSRARGTDEDEAGASESPSLARRIEQGPDSWRRMAEWIAGEG